MMMLKRETRERIASCLAMTKTRNPVRMATRPGRQKPETHTRNKKLETPNQKHPSASLRGRETRNKKPEII